MPISDSPFGEFAGLTEVNDLKRAIEESLESERQRRARAEAELQEMLAQIDQSEKDAQLAKMQEECNQKQLERERGKRDTNSEPKPLMHFNLEIFFPFHIFFHA